MIYDLPGIGTEKHHHSTYLKDQGLRWFDLVILVVHDVWLSMHDTLAKELIFNNIEFIIVQNQVDIKINKDNMDSGLSVEDSKMKMRNRIEKKIGDVKEILRTKSSYEPKIFLADCIYSCRNRNDFPALKEYLEKLMKSYDPSKAEAQSVLKENISRKI